MGMPPWGLAVGGGSAPPCLRLLAVERLRLRLADRKIGLELDAASLDWLATAGYDPVYGARPLKRAIQRELETPIAKAILAGTYGEGSSIGVSVLGERLHFQPLRQVEPALA